MSFTADGSHIIAIELQIMWSLQNPNNPKMSGMVDYGTGEVSSAHGRSLARTTSTMGGVDRGPLGTDDLALLSVEPAH